MPDNNFDTMMTARRDMLVSNLKAQRFLAIASTNAYKGMTMEKDGVELTTQAERLAYTLEQADAEIAKVEAAFTTMSAARQERRNNRQNK